MRPITVLLIPFTLALGGCAGGVTSPTAPAGQDLAPGASMTAVAQDGRPITARCEASFGPAELLAPGVLRQVDTGTCQMAHLGRVEFHSDKVIRLAAGTQTTNATFTAANGDVLRATGTGTNTLARPGLVRFTMNMTFVGGTGRFAGATGNALVEGEASLANGTSWLRLAGAVTFDASDRSVARR